MHLFLGKHTHNVQNFRGFMGPTDPRLGTPEIRKWLCAVLIEEEEGEGKKWKGRKASGLEHGSRLSETDFEPQLCSFPTT